MRPGHKLFSKWRFLVPLLLLVLALILAGHALVNAPIYELALQQLNIQQAPTIRTLRLLNGKTSSLSWIFGRDCSSGVQAYLRSAANDPDAALIGTGWVDPTSGKLIDGQSNNCVPGSLSMDSVVRLIHSKGGMAYLTVTMDTDGSAQAWTTRQAAAYIDKATTDAGYIQAITHQVVRGGYDGVIMDLEGVDHTYPDIQQKFALFNQRVWAALQLLHKPYGIALLHKLSDQDDYYSLNGFENWSLLGRAADFIVIMAVDQSYLTPGPTVSVPWLNQLLAYALHTMPQMLPHIIWELPLYGDVWHWSNGGWVFDGDLTFEASQAILNQLTPAQIDAAATDEQDVYAPHIVYTDASGVKHSLWYLAPQNLYNVITGFWQSIQMEPQFNSTHLQIAVWWRTNEEPRNFWPLLDKLY
jgi:spore germination protein YaaH